MFPKPVTQASASFADVNLVAGVAFDDADHIFTGACMSTIDCNTTPRGVNSRRGVGVNAGIAARSAPRERTPVFRTSSGAIEGTSD